MAQKEVMEHKYFFGWSNLKWLIKELLKIYSNKDSFFSKKRVESGVGFIVAEWGMIYFLLKKMETLDIYSFAIWATIQFAIAGYIVNSIQKEKKEVRTEN
jgi:hypothetical protein